MTPEQIERKEIETLGWTNKPVIKESLDYVYTNVEVLDWITFNERLVEFSFNIIDDYEKFADICHLGVYIGAEIEPML
jgi:hypothetical protein